MASSRSLNISFIRDVTNQKRDDSILISPNDSSNRLYNVLYIDRLNKVKNNNTCTEEEVFDFIENMFTLLVIDKDPFNMIQITAPMFPPVLLETSTLNEYTVRDSIMSVVRNTVRNWPTVKPLKKATSDPVSHHQISRPITRSVTRNLA